MLEHLRGVCTLVNETTKGKFRLSIYYLIGDWGEDVRIRLFSKGGLTYIRYIAKTSLLSSPGLLEAAPKPLFIEIDASSGLGKRANMNIVAQ